MWFIIKIKSLVTKTNFPRLSSHITDLNDLFSKNPKKLKSACSKDLVFDPNAFHEAQITEQQQRSYLMFTVI